MSIPNNFDNQITMEVMVIEVSEGFRFELSDGRTAWTSRTPDFGASVIVRLSKRVRLTVAGAKSDFPIRVPNEPYDMADEHGDNRIAVTSNWKIQHV